METELMVLHYGVKIVWITLNAKPDISAKAHIHQRNWLINSLR